MSQEMRVALEQEDARATVLPIPGTTAPTAAEVVEVVEAAETRSAVASQWQLMRWRFKKHRLAVISL